MLLKKSLIALLLKIFLTSICFGKVIEANPGDKLALTLKTGSIFKSFAKHNIAITYTNLSDFSISTHTIPFSHVDTDDIVNSENKVNIRITENIQPGEYELNTYLIENDQNNFRYYNINTDIQRIIIKKSTSFNRPYLLASNLDKSQVFLSENAIYIELDFLAPEGGFPNLLQVEAIIKERDDTIVLKNTNVIESDNPFGTIKIPVDFGMLTNLRSGSYRILVNLQSKKGLTGLLNTLSDSPEIPEYTYDLGEIHILNDNKTENGETLYISDFGAYPNDGIDDTTAIIKALTALKQTGAGTLLFEAGTYTHSDILRIENMTNFDIKGQNTRLVASNSARSSVIFKECSNFSFSGFQLLSPKYKSRRQEFEATGLSVLHSENFTISNNLIYQSAAAGIMIARGSKYYTIHDNTVLNTKADAIHSTGASAYGAIYNNITDANGDDGIAVVSYLNDSGKSHHIRIFNNSILGNYHGRGIAIVGGSNISIINNHIKETSVAGILLASEYHYNTYGTNEIIVSSNSVINACQNKDNTHPAILIYGRENNTKNKSINAKKINFNLFLRTENIVVNYNYIRSQKCNGHLRLGPNINNIYIQRNIFDDLSVTKPIIANESDYSSFTLDNNTFN